MDQNFAHDDIAIGSIAEWLSGEALAEERWEMPRGVGVQFARCELPEDELPF